MANQNQPSFMDMFSRFGESLNMPRMDVEAVLENHRRNIEALEKSARASAQGAMELAAKQREAVEKGMRDAVEMAESYRASAGNPQEIMGRQAEWARRSFEAAVTNAGEMAEIVRRSGTESVEILRDRIAKSMEEAMKGSGSRK